MLYTYSDAQGSLIALTDADGSVLKKTIDGVVKEIDRFAYDPWGARRDPGNWNVKDSRTSFIINRGYTGHEHLDAFGIINMNGRVYDPLTAQFFSPDPYVQAPDDWLNYNRYTYCSGNPFKYTDPSGELQLGPFYLSLNISWSPNGGLSLGISGGVGLEGGLYIGASINYGFKSGNLSGAVNVGAAGFYAYAGYDTKGGWMAGAGYAIPSAFSVWSPVNITTNMMSAGIGYSEHGGWSGNAAGFNYSSNGLFFDPSVGVAFSLKYGSEYFKTKNLIPLDPNDKSGKPKAIYGDNEGINKEADALLKRPKSLTTIHADGTGGVGEQKNGSYVYGRTIYNGINSTVYIGQEAYMSNAFLYMIIQHEYAHVGLNQAGFGDYTDAQEAAAYTISYNQAMKWGMEDYASWFLNNRSYFNDLNIYKNMYPTKFQNFDLNSTIRKIIPGL